MDQRSILNLLQTRKRPRQDQSSVKVSIPVKKYEQDQLSSSNQDNTASFLSYMKKSMKLVGLDIPNTYKNTDEYKEWKALDIEDDELNIEHPFDDLDDADESTNNNDIEGDNRLISRPSRISGIQSIFLENISEDEMSMINDKISELIRNDELIKNGVENTEEKSVIRKGDKRKGVLNDDIEDDDELLTIYEDYIKNNIKLNVSKTFIMNNKYQFLDEIKRMTSKLRLNKETRTCEDQAEDKSGFTPLLHQKLVQRYLNTYTPYRGLLLYHGLGSGKTCTSIGVIEAMKYNKRVFIMTPASLQKNYKTQMKFCGDQLFKTENYWVEIDVPLDNSNESRSKVRTLSKLTSFSIRDLRKMRTVYLVDTTRKESNFDSFNVRQQREISNQIDKMISRKFNYINYNGITDKSWHKYYQVSPNKNPFNNSVIIIDEAHNFVSRVINKLNLKKESVSTKIYEAIMSADNCNVVALSGTPMINYPCELGTLFNMISGYNYCITVEVNVKDPSKLNPKVITKLFEQDDNTDFVEFTTRRNVFRVVRNPYNFINRDNKLIYNPEEGKKSLFTFKQEVSALLTSNEYQVTKSIIEKFKSFPDTHAEFNSIFINKKGEFVHKDYFQTKILGMVSYLGDKKEMMPRMIVPQDYEETKEEIFIEKIEMNEYVLSQYKISREIEKSIDMNAQRVAKQRNLDSTSSSYKIFSRATCNFAFPENIERPKIQKRAIDLDETDLDALDDQQMMNDNDGRFDTSDTGMHNNSIFDQYRKDIQSALLKLADSREKVFMSDLPFLVKRNAYNGSISINNEEDESETTDVQFGSPLEKYSPKYYRLLKNLLTNNRDMCNLMYSNFRTLEGIGIFKLVLDFYGYTQLRVVKNKESGIMELDFSHPYYKEDEFTERKYYALYTGTESIEEKEIIRNIYNNNLDDIPSNMKEQIIQRYGDNINNYHGEIINLLIISSSGAEGIDLKNVRTVHILEPYWHPVRIDQVVGRARRICSHMNLPEEERDVTVHMYVLTYPKNFLRKNQNEPAYINLITADRDTSTSISSTDEKLYNISKRKKKVAKDILTSLKEASIDCLVNYDDRSKCMTLPIAQSKKLNIINKINYRDDAYERMSLDVGEPQDNQLRRITLNVVGDNNQKYKKQFAVDMITTPNPVYDLEDFKSGIINKIGTVERQDNELYLKRD